MFTYKETIENVYSLPDEPDLELFLKAAEKESSTLEFNICFGERVFDANLIFPEELVSFVGKDPEEYYPEFEVSDYSSDYSTMEEVRQELIKQINSKYPNIKFKLTFSQ